MLSISMFIQAYSKYIIIVALIFALWGTVLLSWDLIQWSNIKKAQFDSEYGVITSMTENIAKAKWGSTLIGVSIITQLVAELFKR